MKVITVCQPYAHLIMTRAKLVENRTWSTRYRGRLLIHAGKSEDWLTEDNYGIPREQLVFGAIVAEVRIVDCIWYEALWAIGRNRDRLRKQYPWLADHEHANGPWCWILEYAKPVGPWPWRGAQGLWDIEDAELARLEGATR